MNKQSREEVIIQLPEKIRAVLGNLGQLLGTVQEAVNEVCILFQQGELGRGLQGLCEVIEALQHIQKALDFLTSTVYGEPLGLFDSKQAIENTFPALLLSLEEHDFVALSDILQYEFQPALSECQKRVTGKILLPN